MIGSMLNKRIDMDEDLRDFFAAFAMNGIISRGGLHPDLMPENAIARRAYELADVMMEARKQENEDVKCK
jgi:hypothetical protein